MAALGYLNTWEDKLSIRFSAVLIRPPPVLRYLHFMSVCESSTMTLGPQAPCIMCLGRTNSQWKGGEYESQNGVRAADAALPYVYSRLPLDALPSSIHLKKGGNCFLQLATAGQ